MQNRPKISVISPSKNSGRFLKETIESILAQTYKNWEHIVVDGISTDETLDVLKQYPHIRWISEKDSCADEAHLKGVAMARGEYVMLCCISDGYLDKNWFKKCVDILDSRPEISLVWGIDQNMLEDGTLDTIYYNSWFLDPPPSGTDYIYYWLKNRTLFHERDFCIRKRVFDECFPSFDPKEVDHELGHLTFTYNFNRLGYLPQLVKTVAAYARLHSNAIGQRQAITGEAERGVSKYFRAIEEYKRKVLQEEIEHQYRDGSGQLLPDKFDLRKLEQENKFKKMITYLIPPIFICLQSKLMARYRVYKNIRELHRSGMSP